jgi:hypothetical protein
MKEVRGAILLFCPGHHTRHLYTYNFELRPCLIKGTLCHLYLIWNKLHVQYFVKWYRGDMDVQSTAHQTIHFRLCTALISRCITTQVSCVSLNCVYIFSLLRFYQNLNNYTSSLISSGAITLPNYRWTTSHISFAYFT